MLDRHSSCDALGRVLGGLAARQGTPPKFRYPSAGTLYPVQTYVCVPPGRFAGVDGGSYYHDPDGHALIRLSEALPDIPGDAAFLLLLVAENAAIAPVYGEHAGTFCLLEAGYMGALLAEGAGRTGIALRAVPTSGCDAAMLRSHLLLGEEQPLLAAWAGVPNGSTVAGWPTKAAPRRC
jgi:epothilone synthetase B